MNAKRIGISVTSGATFWSRLFLVNASGVLTWLAVPDERAVSALAWVCMVPWLFAVTKAQWKERVLWGLLYGLWYAVPGKWGSIWTAAHHLYPSIFLCSLVTFLFFAFYLLPFVLYSALPLHQHRTSPLRPLLHAAWFTVLLSWTPVVFPVNPADMLHDQPWMIQLADLGGVPIVLFLLFGVNAYVAGILQSGFHNPAIKKQVLAFIPLVSLAAAYGGWRIHDLQAQENKGFGSWVSPIAAQTQLSKYNMLSALTRNISTQPETASERTLHAAREHPQTNFAVWPELPLDFSRGNRERLIHEHVGRLAKQIGNPILYGCIETIADTTPALYYNSARFSCPEEGEPPVYHKRFLTPFYEHNPLERWINLGRYRMVPGSTDPVIDVCGRGKVIPAICYEVHFPEQIRRGVRNGGQIIVHMANFQSFGDGPIPFYDYAMSKFRTVEFRVPMVKSCNHGYGAFIKATGETVEGSLNSPNQPNALCFPLWVPPQRSFYSVYGDLFLYGATVWVTLDVLYLHRSRKRLPICRSDGS